jgi:hypothetical protein
LKGFWYKFCSCPAFHFSPTSKLTAIQLVRASRPRCAQFVEKKSLSNNPLLTPIIYCFSNQKGFFVYTSKCGLHID